jgi:pyruvate kinase
MRRTKIIATVGPATRERHMLEALVEAGMDVARINCSHLDSPQDYQAYQLVIENLRDIAAWQKKPVGILLDLSGPKIRTAAMTDNKPAELVDGQEFMLTSRPVRCDSKGVSTNYDRLARDVKRGDRILLDDGLIELSVLSCDETDVLCRVVHGGLLKSHKGINLPGVRLSIPALTQKDAHDLEFGKRNRVDFVALSFVRDPEDVRHLHRLIGNHYPPVAVIAKLEKPEALEHLDEILELADGVMIARGDLGVELPCEQVPPVQKRIARKANAVARPVITATQMLESMIENPTPTRAEVSDVANAIFDGTDAVMLSAESASGKHPIESVKMMARIACAAENSINGAVLKTHDMPSSAHAIAHAACEMAVDMNARAIAAFTRTGSTARMIAQLRPPTPIVALTQHDHIYRQMALCWGVIPLMMTEVRDSEGTLALVEETLLKHGLAEPGETIIVTGGLPIAARGPANFVKLSVLPAINSGTGVELKGI